MALKTKRLPARKLSSPHPGQRYFSFPRMRLPISSGKKSYLRFCGISHFSQLIYERIPIWVLFQRARWARCLSRLIWICGISHRSVD